MKGYYSGWLSNTFELGIKSIRKEEKKKNNIFLHDICLIFVFTNEDIREPLDCGIYFFNSSKVPI